MIKHAAYPITTVGDALPAPPGWSWRPLTSVARLESGHTPSRRQPTYWDGGSIPWLSLKDIRGLEGRYIFDTADKPTQDGIDHSSARVLPKGTVAFCRTASVGKVVILGRDMATSQDFANWVCGADVLPEYLYEALRASGGQFDKEKQGSTHKTIYMPTLGSFRVLLPPLAEQKRIVEILDKADAIRRKRKEALALTEELLRSTFLEMFGDPVTNPKGWPLKDLGELFSTPPRIGTLEPASESGTHQVIRVGELGDHDVALDRCQWVSPSASEIDRFGTSPGDVLLARAIGSEAHLGKASIVQATSPMPLFDSHVMRLRFQADRLEPEFFRQWLHTPGGRALFMRQAGRTAVQFNVNGKQIGRITIPVPPIDTQRRFVSFYKKIAGVQAHLGEALQLVEALFASLLDRAFRGELTAPPGASRSPRQLSLL